MKVGQVLPISVPYSGKAVVKINDLPMMIGEAGNSNGKFSVQVTDDFDTLKQTTQAACPLQLTASVHLRQISLAILNTVRSHSEVIVG